MKPEQYAGFPDELTVREVRVDHQVLVTTLVDHRKVSKYDLSERSAQRWNVELDLRNLKTTTGMDVLNCQTPQMNEKQLWVHLLAYNVIRPRMAQAASNAVLRPTLIAQCKVGNRPGRIEPRMRKQRPKPYPRLKVPRAKARRKTERHGQAWETK